MVHFSRCITPVHLAELEQWKALFEIFDNNLAQISDEKFFSFGVFKDLKRALGRSEVFTKQIVYLVIVDLEVAAFNDEESIFTIFTDINLFKQLLKSMNQDTFVLSCTKIGRRVTSFRLSASCAPRSIVICPALVNWKADTTGAFI